MFRQRFGVRLSRQLAYIALALVFAVTATAQQIRPTNSSTELPRGYSGDVKLQFTNGTNITTLVALSQNGVLNGVCRT
jgi:hypothetical protein